MRSLLFVSALLGLGAAAPQRGIGGCGCREVICPNQGPDHCACINAAAEDCARYQRGDCPQPPRCNDNGRPNNGNPGYTQTYPRNGGNGPFNNPNTVYTTMPITYTVTTTLPGFYSPRPVTSYSTIVSMVTVTLSGPPPNQGGPGWNQPQTIWQTTTVNGIPPWATRSSTPRPPPPTTTYRPPPTTSTWKPQPTTPRSTSIPPPWSVPPPPPSTYTPPPPVQTTTSSRPSPWSPPPSNGGGWTPIQNPTIPTAQPTSVAPPAPPPPSSASPGYTPIPTDLGQPPPVAGAPQKCGPGAAKCPDGTYCDPQPLCSIGEDCAGVCLPTFSSKFVGFSQPWEIRRNIWQELLNSGNYSIYKYNGDS